MGEYSKYTAELLPSWLQGPHGKAYWEAVSEVVDELLLARLHAATQVGIVETAPVDALPYLGSDRMLERYPAESDAIYRDRLEEAPTVWSIAGTPPSVTIALHTAFPGPAWDYVEYFSSPPTFGSSGFWSQFIIIADPANGIVERTWGEVGFKWGDAEKTWGTDLTPQEVALLKGICLKWKPGHVLCTGIKIRIDGEYALIPPQFAP